MRLFSPFRKTKYWVVFAVIVILFVAVYKVPTVRDIWHKFGINRMTYASSFGQDGYVKSATYFADEWPVNFWNSDTDTLHSDMKKIRSDGFDSIILVVPWREFQPTIDPVSYNEYAFNKLKMIMQVAAAEQLGVYLRIGYTWDFFNDSDDAIEKRFINVFWDEVTQNAWKQYVSELYNCVKKHDNFKGAFLTWEDFPLMGIVYGDEDLRKQYAEKLGYRIWLKDNCSLQDYNSKFFTNHKTYDDIFIPKSTEPSVKEYYRFSDHLQMSLLEQTQNIFPNISMEVRLDEDLIVYPDKKEEWFRHTQTYPCGKADYTAVMYGIPMGFVNNGEKVTAEQALKKTGEILYKLKTQNEGKPIYVEQFLFADNTPGFSHNAQVKENELSLYLQNVDDVLRLCSAGYGIWTYKNYRVNLIYNPGFYLSQQGWEGIGSPEYKRIADNGVCVLKAGSGLKQILPASRMYHFADETYISSCVFSMDVVDCHEKSSVAVTVGSVTKVVDFSAATRVEIQFPKQDNMDVQIKAVTGEFCIDNVRLFSYVQNGNLYDEFGHELKHAEDIRILNRKLSHNQKR